MRPAIAALRDALEAAWIEDAELADLVSLATLLDARAPLVRQLGELCASELSDEEKDALRGLVERVHARDRRLLEALEARRRVAGEALEHLVGGRAAVRGYRREAAGTPSRGALLEKA